MKNIRVVETEKYKSVDYSPCEDGIYKQDDIYVVTLSFMQEPELDEGDDASYISQYPLEDVLDKFYVYVTDFYKTLNKKGEKTCYLEFGSPDLEDIKRLLSIVGKHVYNREVVEGENTYIELVIE